jgi:hypothetical protein
MASGGLRVHGTEKSIFAVRCRLNSGFLLDGGERSIDPSRKEEE